jgi:hypothetical protein
MPPPPAAPLEVHDPDRARALKTKIRDRISDIRRHLLALRAGMAEFGEDFDLDAGPHPQAGDGSERGSRISVNANLNGALVSERTGRQLVPNYLSHSKRA